MSSAQGSILLAIFLVGNLSASDGIVALPASQSSSQIEQDAQVIYLASKTKAVVPVKAYWVHHSSLLKRNNQKDSGFGTPDKPHKVKLSPDLISCLTESLSLLEQQKESELLEMFQKKIPLKELLDIYVSSDELEIESCKRAAEQILQERLKTDEAVALFIESSEFRETLEAGNKLTRNLSLSIISPEEQKYLRSQLYNDLRTSFHPECFQINRSSTFILIGGKENDQGGVELWTPLAKYPDLQLVTPEPIKAALFQSGPEIITLGASQTSLWNLLTRTDVPLAVLDQGKAKKKHLWGLCTTDDFAQVGLGIQQGIFVLNMAKKQVTEMTPPLREEGASSGKMTYSELLFCGSSSPVLVALGTAGELDFYCSERGTCLTREAVHKETVSRFVVQGTTLITMTDSGEFCVWDGSREAKKRLLKRGIFASPTSALAISGQMVSLPLEHEIEMYDGTIPNLAEATSFKAPYLIVKQNNSLLVTEQGEKEATLLPCKNYPTMIYLSPDSSFLIGKNGSRSVRVWHFFNQRIKEFLATKVTMNQAFSLKLLVRYLQTRNNASVDTAAKQLLFNIALLHQPAIVDAFKTFPAEIAPIFYACFPEVQPTPGRELYKERSHLFWQTAMPSPLLKQDDSVPVGEEKLQRGSSAERLRNSQRRPKDPSLLRSVSLRGMSEEKRRAAGLLAPQEVQPHNDESHEVPSPTKHRRNTLSGQDSPREIDNSQDKPRRKHSAPYEHSPRSQTDRPLEIDQGPINSPDESPSSKTDSSSEKIAKTDRSHRKKGDGLSHSSDGKKRLPKPLASDTSRLSNSALSVSTTGEAREIDLSAGGTQAGEPLLVSSVRLKRRSSHTSGSSASPSLSRKKTLDKTSDLQVDAVSANEDLGLDGEKTATQADYLKAFAKASARARNTNSPQATRKKTEPLIPQDDSSTVRSLKLDSADSSEEQSAASTVNSTPRKVALPNILMIAERQIQAKSAFSMRNYAEAFTIFSELNKLPDTFEEKKRSHWWLAELYFHGWGIPHNFKLALTHYEQAQKQTVDKEMQAAAYERLGTMHFYGYGCPPDEKEAKKYFGQAHDLSTKLLVEKVKQFQGKITNEQLLQKKLLTCVKAMSGFFVGLVDGKSESKNVFNRALAESSQANGMALLSSYDADCKQVKKEDPSIALLLSKMYLLNRRLPCKNPESCFVEILKSKDEYVLAEGYGLLGEYYLMEKVPTLRKAIQNLKKAARQDHNQSARARASLLLGRLYTGEYSAEADSKEATFFLKQAIDQTYEVGISVEATYLYALLHETDEPSTAADYYTKVAEQTSYPVWRLKARIKLGEQLFKLQDFEGAYADFTLVVKEAEKVPLEPEFIAKAWFHLGQMHEEGFGNVIKDSPTARAYYELVVKNLPAGELLELAQAKLSTTTTAASTTESNS